MVASTLNDLEVEFFIGFCAFLFLIPLLVLIFVYMKIRNQKKMYHSLFSILPIPAFLIDNKLNLKAWNDQAKKQFNFRGVKKQLENVFPIDRIKNDLLSKDHFIIHGGSKNLNFEILTRKVKVCRKELFLLLAIDVNRSLHLEQENNDLQKEILKIRQQFDAIYNSMNEGFCLQELIYDDNNQAVDYIYLDVNEAFEKILEKKKKEIVGKKSSELSISGTPSYLSLYSEVVKNKVPFGFESYSPQLEKYFKYSVNSAGENKFVTIILDITKLKEAEALLLYKNEEITSRNEELKENIETTKAILNAPSDAIFLFDPEGQIIDCNQAASSLLDSEKAQLVGKEIINLVPGKMHGKIRKMISQVKKTRKNQVYEIKIRHSYYDTMLYPVLDEKKEITKIVVITRNITNRKKVEFALRKAKIKAEETDNLKSAFLANMSHEIKTPMNSIMGFSKLMSDNVITDEKRKKYTNIVYQCSKNLLRIINDIIDFSKIEAGQLSIIESNCRINLLLEELLNIFEVEQINGKGIEIRITSTVPKYKSIVKTDPVRLKQILVNLISNALKFTDTGFVEFGYHLRDEKWVEFFVKDTGIGISKKDQGIIFERFRQLDDPRDISREGTGLGLSISKALVEKLGGSIWVESTENIGTTFFFTIPYKI